MTREKCSTSTCSAIARRTVRRERYCERCAKDIERAAYLATLPADVIEVVRFRQTFAVAPVEEASQPARLELALATGWRSRR